MFDIRHTRQSVAEHGFDWNEWLWFNYAEDPNSPSDLWCKIIDRCHEIYKEELEKKKD